MICAAIKSVCSEYRIHNADVYMKEDCDVDDLVDVIEGSRIYIPCIYVINKIDQVHLLLPITFQRLSALHSLCSARCPYHLDRITKQTSGSCGIYVISKIDHMQVSALNQGFFQALSNLSLLCVMVLPPVCKTLWILGSISM